MFPRKIAAACVLSVLVACGGDDTDSGVIEGNFVVSKGEQGLACRDVSEVERVELNVYNESGVSKLPGFPIEADCEAGTFSIPGLDAGKYQLELVARGTLETESDAVLFRAQRPLNLPSAEPIELVLGPEVAFFELAWSFETDDGGSPCETEVDRVVVFISTGASQGAVYDAVFRCDESPVVIPEPLAPREYTVRLDAKSSTGNTVFSSTDMRLLQRGLNDFAAVLRPLGGRLLIDWQFVIGASAPIQSCDDARVGVDAIDIEVAGTTGGDVDVEIVSCEESRPYAFTSARFARGRELEISLRAEGMSRFYGRTTFTMPEGDYELPLLSAEAVGTATVGWTATSSGACASGVDSFVVSVVHEDNGQSFEDSASSEVNTLRFTDVPYGVYDVSVIGYSGTTERCRAEGQRAIEARDNDWAPFSL